MGALLGPHTHTTRAQQAWATEPGCLPKGRAARSQRAPDTRGPSER